ncbi:MAG: hypothetical protein AAB454_00745 [Patescibacteria group bacterium]
MCESVRVVEIKKCADCDGFGVKVGNDFIKKWQNGVEETAAMLMAGRSCQPLDTLFHKLTIGKPKCSACKGVGVWTEE